MDYLNMKLIYDILTDCKSDSLAMMSSLTYKNGQMYFERPSQLILYAHKYGGVLKDDEIHEYVFRFLSDLFKKRNDLIYCSLIKFKNCTNKYISFNIRCRTIFDIIDNKKHFMHFNIIIKTNGEYEFLIVDSINE